MGKNSIKGRIVKNNATLKSTRKTKPIKILIGNYPNIAKFHGHLPKNLSHCNLGGPLHLSHAYLAF